MKKNKALFVLLFYSIFLVIFSTEIILNEFMNARRELLVESSSNSTSEILVFTKEFWSTIPNKREFIIDNKYYDLISHKTIGNKIVARVIRDDFEVVLKKTAENLTKKNSKNKKLHSSVSITQFITDTTNIHFFKVKKNTLVLPKYFAFFDDNFSCNIFQPPKLIELT